MNIRVARVALAASLVLILMHSLCSPLGGGAVTGRIYAGDCESKVFAGSWHTGKVLELKIEGSSVGSISLMLPALHGKPLQALARYEDRYVGASCWLEENEQGTLELTGTIVFTHAEERNEPDLSTIEFTRVLQTNVWQKIRGRAKGPIDPDIQLTDEALADIEFAFVLSVTIRDQAPEHPPIRFH